MSKALVFGGTGALGSEIVSTLRNNGWKVTVASRSGADGYLNISQPNWAETIEGQFDAVVWAQGANYSGGILDASSEDVRAAFESNVIFVLETLRLLHDSGALHRPSRGVILSSIWQEYARENKLAYLASKASLSGVIPSLAMDMASSGFAVNAVLPGVIDTPMTRSQLTEAQIIGVENGTPGGELAKATHVANAVHFLASSSSFGINGQSIIVDNGWSIKREI